METPNVGEIVLYIFSQLELEQLTQSDVVDATGPARLNGATILPAIVTQPWSAGLVNVVVILPNGTLLPKMSVSPYDSTAVDGSQFPGTYKRQSPIQGNLIQSNPPPYTGPLDSNGMLPSVQVECLTTRTRVLTNRYD